MDMATARMSVFPASKGGDVPLNSGLLDIERCYCDSKFAAYSRAIHARRLRPTPSRDARFEHRSVSIRRELPLSVAPTPVNACRLGRADAPSLLGRLLAW